MGPSDENSNENATTTTTEEQTTTTTTEQDTTDTTTQVPRGDEASANYPGGEASPNAPRRGEVVADPGAETPVLGDDRATDVADAQAENISQAKSDALVNHDREQNSQPEYQRPAQHAPEAADTSASSDAPRQ